jgi:hypothetical protein
MKTILAYSIILIFYSCIWMNKQETKNSIWAGFQDGWAGNPDDRKSKPFDYFYMKMAGRASEKAIRKKSGNTIEMSCIDSAMIDAKGNFIGRMIYDFYGNLDNKQFQEEKYSFLPEGIPTFPVWNLVSTDGESPGKHLVRKLMNQPLKLQIQGCRPLALPDPEIPYSEFKKCECILYSHVPGGRDYIKELERKSFE